MIDADELHDALNESVAVMDELFGGLLTGLDGFGDTLHEMHGRIVEFVEHMPTRGQALYAALNKPWQLNTWRYLRHAPTRRYLRKVRADYDDADHARWARQLVKGMRQR